MKRVKIMLANQLTRILSYTKDLDIIKKINNKDDYLVTGIIDFFDTCYNDIFPIYDVKEEQRKRLINAVLDGDMPDKKLEEYATFIRIYALGIPYSRRVRTISSRN